MPVPGMDRPPMPSPDIQSQMGTPQQPPSGAGLSQMKPMDQSGPAPGAPNPHGFIMAQADAIKKVLNQMAQAEVTFAPFAQKMIQVMESGVSAVSAAPSGQQEAAPAPAEAGTAGPSPSAPGGGSMPALG